jgi:hypothetical protein
MDNETVSNGAFDCYLLPGRLVVAYARGMCRCVAI